MPSLVRSTLSHNRFFSKSPIYPTSIPRGTRLAHSMRQLTPADLNPAVQNVQYAVRGELAIKAEDLRAKLESKSHSLPFEKIINSNIGNPQQKGLDQPPITFTRQVRPSAFSQSTPLRPPLLLALFLGSTKMKAKCLFHSIYCRGESNFTGNKQTRIRPCCVSIFRSHPHFSFHDANYGLQQVSACFPPTCLPFTRPFSSSASRIACTAIHGNPSAETVVSSTYHLHLMANYYKLLSPPSSYFTSLHST